MRERLGLVERDVLDELVRRQRLAHAEADALPAVGAALPVERRAGALAVAPFEPGRAPVPCRAVAAAVDELHELGVRHRRSVDDERLDLDLVRLELVVVRPGLVFGAEHERPPATWISSGPDGARSGLVVDGTGYERPERSCSASSIASWDASSFWITSPNA